MMSFLTKELTPNKLEERLKTLRGVSLTRVYVEFPKDTTPEKIIEGKRAVEKVTSAPFTKTISNSRKLYKVTMHWRGENHARG
jgi:hypothetical protein